MGPLDQPMLQDASEPSNGGALADYTALPADTIFFRPPILEQDLASVCAVEAASYPEDEAATPAKLQYRMEHASDQFLLAVRSSRDGNGDELLGLLKAYLNYVRATTPDLTEARLICKQLLVGLYEVAGFQLLGPSDVVHGKDQWLEMAVQWQ